MEKYRTRSVAIVGAWFDSKKSPVVRRRAILRRSYVEEGGYVIKPIILVYANKLEIIIIILKIYLMACNC